MALELLTRGVGDVVGGSVAGCFGSGRGVEFLVGVAAAGGGGGAGGSRSLIRGSWCTRRQRQLSPNSMSSTVY